MYAQIQWTSYRFSAPETLTEELYEAAKFSPTEFRQELITNHLRHASKHVGRTLLIAWGLAAALIGIASLFDGAKRGSWSYTFEELFAVVGTVSALSGALSAASFIRYALNYRKYWLGVGSAALDSESYSEFLSVAPERKSTAA